jgi:hypothetical protein
MKIVNGKAVFEEVQCWHCEGTGKYEYFITCPNWRKPVAHKPGRKCEICGSKNQHDHKVVGSEIRDCTICNGKGSMMENLYDSDRGGVWKTLPVKLIRSNREQTWAEAYLGVGLWSCTDYGAHQKMTDEELIQKLHEERSGYHQFCKYVDKELNVAPEIVVLCNDMGYSVIANMKGGAYA